MLIHNKTGEQVECYFKRVTEDEIKSNRYIPMNDGAFQWLKPLSQGYEIFSLVVKDQSDIAQGLIAVKPNAHPDFMCLDIDIVESAPHSKRMSRNREYVGVGKDLLAFACAYSFEQGLDGYVELTSKTSNIKFYEQMGAQTSYGHQLYFDTISASELIKKFLPGGVKWWSKA
ncbi:MAG: hypothetical protein ABF649_20480 [Bacillus sp. (in: firmicutes)]